MSDITTIQGRTQGILAQFAEAKRSSKPISNGMSDELRAVFGKIAKAVAAIDKEENRLEAATTPIREERVVADESHSHAFDKWSPTVDAMGNHHDEMQATKRYAILCILGAGVALLGLLALGAAYNPYVEMTAKLRIRLKRAGAGMAAGGTLLTLFTLSGCRRCQRAEQGWLRSLRTSISTFDDVAVAMDERAKVWDAEAEVSAEEAKLRAAITPWLRLFSQLKPLLENQGLIKVRDE